MKKILLTAALLFSTVFIVYSQEGETIFQSTCTACHTIGKGKLVGPDLKGINKKYPEKWLIEWIRSSQTMVQKGDAKAKKVFEENFQVPMPDNNLTEAEIKSVLAYIKSQSTETIKPVQGTEPKSSTGVNISNQNPSDIAEKQTNSNKVATQPNISAQLNVDSLPGSTIVVESSSQLPTVQPAVSIKTESYAKTATSSGYNKTFLHIGLSILALMLIATIIVLSRVAGILRMANHQKNKSEHNE